MHTEFHAHAEKITCYNQHMKIHVLNCGYIRISENLIETGGMMSDLRRAVLTPDPKRVELPVHAFLIEHRNGLFLIDTGLSRDISPAGEYDKKASEKVLTKHLAAVYHPYVPAGMAVHEQLASMGISPAELEAVIITNFDIDHVSGLKHVSDAGRIIVPEDEAYWSVRTKYRIRQNRELWEPYKIERLFFRGYLTGPMNKAIDVLGDGSLMMVSIPGYTDGQAGVKVSEKGRYAFIASDAAFSPDSWKRMKAPGLGANEALQLRTMRWLAKTAEDPACAGIFCTHDPALNHKVIEM